MTYKKYLYAGIVVAGVVVVLLGMRYFGWDAIKNFFDNGASGGDSAEIDLGDSNNASDSIDEFVDSSTATSMGDDIFTDSAVATASKKKKSSSGASIASPVAVVAQNNQAPVIDAPAPSCPFPQRGVASTRVVIFNEIAWMGSPSSSNAEWMELKNISNASVDLNGWSINDASGKIKINFSRGDAISAAAIFLLSRTSGSSAKIYSGDLANAGDALALLDAHCNVSDMLDASAGWIAGDNATKQTMERDDDHIGWHTSAMSGGTPGAENSVGVSAVATSSRVNVSPVSLPSPSSFPPPSLSPPTSSQAGNSSSSFFSPPAITPTSTTASTTSSPPDMQPPSPSSPITITTPTVTFSSSPAASLTVPVGLPLIEGVQIAGVSSTNDLVKIYNPTGAAIDMSGWKLRKRSATGTDYSLKQFSSGSIVNTGQFFVWANSAGGFSDAVHADASSTETLSADNSVALLDASGTIIDSLAWGTGIGQYGEGSPYPTNPAPNQVLTRMVAAGSLVDTGNNQTDFYLQ